MPGPCRQWQEPPEPPERMADRGLEQHAATRPACLAVPDRRVKLITRGRVIAAGFSRVARPPPMSLVGATEFDLTRDNGLDSMLDASGTMHVPTQDRGLVDKSRAEIVSELASSWRSSHD